MIAEENPLNPLMCIFFLRAISQSIFVSNHKLIFALQVLCHNQSLYDRSQRIKLALIQLRFIIIIPRIQTLSSNFIPSSRNSQLGARCLYEVCLVICEEALALPPRHIDVCLFLINCRKNWSSLLQPFFHKSFHHQAYSQCHLIRV